MLPALCLLRWEHQHNNQMTLWNTLSSNNLIRCHRTHNTVYQRIILQMKLLYYTKYTSYCTTFPRKEKACLQHSLVFLSNPKHPREFIQHNWIIISFWLSVYTVSYGLLWYDQTTARLSGHVYRCVTMAGAKPVCTQKALLQLQCGCHVHSVYMLYL